MRIIGGAARGRKLAGFRGRDIRPTSDRTREAVFSMLLSRLGSLQGIEVLDLFSGTGAFALEALSRGARGAVMVDNGGEARRLIPANLRTCGFEDRAEFLRSDVLTALPRLRERGPFALIFLDPPYAEGLTEPCLRTVAETGLLTEDGLLCAETAATEDIAERHGNLVLQARRRYGAAAIHLFAHEDTRQ